MCQSLQNLSTRAGGSDFEPECQTNPECNGIVCELDIFGSVFYLETIVLPCDYAVDVVIRDSQRQPTFMSVYNRTEIHTVNIGSFSAPLYVEIVPRPYSMEVYVSVNFFSGAKSCKVSCHINYRVCSNRMQAKKLRAIFW